MADAVAALPAGILATSALVMFFAGRVRKSDVSSVVLCACALALAAGAVGFGQLAPRDIARADLPASTTVAAGQPNVQSSKAVTRRYVVDDRLSRSATWLALGLALLAALAAGDGEAAGVGRRFAILLLSLAGVLLSAIANDLALAVMAIELAALPATLLLFLERDASNARGAATRSLALGILALAMLVGGAVLVRLSYGTTNLEDLRAALPQLALSRHFQTPAVASAVAGKIGFVMLLAGLGVHFLAAPFQLAAAEIFEGAKSWTIGLLAIFPRGAALLLMIRVLVYGPPRLHGTSQTLFTAVGFLTILIGGVLAFWQSRIRRLLAFTVVFQSGLILASLAAGCSERARPTATSWIGTEIPGGVGVACLCFAIDSLAIVGLLAIIASRRRSDRPLDDVEQIADEVRGDGVMAAALCVLLASLAGVPPFGGFWPRVAILRSILSISVPAEHGFLPHQNVDYVVVAIAAAIGLILLATVSLGIVKKVLFDDLDAPRITVLRDDRSGKSNRLQAAAVATGLVLALAVVVLGVFPGPASRAAAWGAADERAIAQASEDREFASPEGGTAIRRWGRGGDADDL